jgi:hypothetical protein
LGSSLAERLDELAPSTKATTCFDLGNHVGSVVSAMAKQLEVGQDAPKVRWISMATVDEYTGELGLNVAVRPVITLGPDPFS